MIVEKREIPTGNKREPKVFSIFHDSMMRKPWILLPIGTFYNRELQEAKEGDIILFSDGKRKEIEYASVIPLKNSLTGYLCKKTYIAGLPIVMRRWDMNAEFENYGHGSVSRDECLIIFFKEDKNWECKDGQCSKRKL